MVVILRHNLPLNDSSFGSECCLIDGTDAERSVTRKGGSHNMVK